MEDAIIVSDFGFLVEKVMLLGQDGRSLIAI